MSGNLVQACFEGDLARVRELIAVYPTQEGQALAAEYDVRFIEASAKADVNVTEAFQAIAQQVIDRIPRGASRPASRQLSAKKSSKKGCSC